MTRIFFWVAAIVHTIGAGSDASELWFLALSGLMVVPATALLTLRWLSRGAAGFEPLS